MNTTQHLSPQQFFSRRTAKLVSNTVNETKCTVRIIILSVWTVVNAWLVCHIHFQSTGPFREEVTRKHDKDHYKYYACFLNRHIYQQYLLWLTVIRQGVFGH